MPTACLTCDVTRPYVCGGPDDPSGGARCLLTVLVREVNAYNAPDMLDGYLDSLGTDLCPDEPFNDLLVACGFDPIVAVQPA